MASLVKPNILTVLSYTLTVLLLGVFGVVSVSSASSRVHRLAGNLWIPRFSKSDLISKPQSKTISKEKQPLIPKLLVTSFWIDDLKGSQTPLIR